MNNTKLIFFEFSKLYQIFNELNNFFNFDLKNANNKQELESELSYNSDYLVITNNRKLKSSNKIVLEKMPIKFNQILEKINIVILKSNFSKKSNIKVKDYKIDLNSRKIFLNKNFLKLTEKEIKIIVYLSKSIEPVSIDELQKEIWGYGVDLETHTVETHIHRLRKKVFSTFEDQNFIISTKNGYQII